MSNATTGHARTEVNRQKRIAKAAKAVAYKASHRPRVSRGTARYLRRRAKQLGWMMKHQAAA
jgi:hypothetical protein